MKSIALVLWLMLGNGKEEFLATRHFDDVPSCVAKAESIKAERAAKGQKIRYLCQEVIEEDTDVDMYGNPIKPEHADKN